MIPTYSIKNALQSTDRYKLFVLWVKPGELSEAIADLQNEDIQVVNLGKELAAFVENLEDDPFLHFEVHDYTSRWLEKPSPSRDGSAKRAVAIYNIGILMEPRLEMNAAAFLKDLSKTNVVIILWEYPPMEPERLHWPVQQDTIFLDFSDALLKNLEYAV